MRVETKMITVLETPLSSNLVYSFEREKHTRMHDALCMKANNKVQCPLINNRFS